MLVLDHDHRQIRQTELPRYPHLADFSPCAADHQRGDERSCQPENFKRVHHLADISRTCLAFSFMAANRNCMSVPVETIRAPMAMNSAANFGLVDRPPTPTCLPCLRQASMVRA